MKFLLVLQKETQFQRSWSVIVGNFLIKQRFFIIGLGGDEIDVGFESSQDPFSILSGVQADHRVAA